MSFRVLGQVPEARAIEIEAFVASQRITEQVFRALDALGLCIAEIINMDEYTLDLVVPLPDGLTLVYDTT